MNGDSFYMTLFSNVVNKDVRNKIGNFITPLPPISLDNRWKVGLCEIRYSNTWYNIRKPCAINLVDDNDNTFVAEPLFIHPGRYVDAQVLIDEIQRLMDKLVGMIPNTTVVSRPYIRVKRISNMLEVVVGETSDGRNIYPLFSGEIESMLGAEEGFFDPQPKNLQSKTVLAYNMCDMTGGVNGLLVYCDVVDHSFVGDARAKLLRVVKIPPKSIFGETVVVTYDRPHYIPLSMREFQSIEIDIKDDAGSTIDFRAGRVILTLHFQRDG
jgi:hypothetical protein